MDARAPSFRRLPRAVREQQMLDAAVEVFSRQGYHGASVDEIAELAGISKPMIYAYVGTKEELFSACLHREGVRLIEAIAMAASMGLAPREQLERGLRAFFGFVAGHCDGWSVLYRQARGQDPFADVLAQLRERMIELVTGAVAASPDAALLARALVGAAEALADWVADHPEVDSDDIAARFMTTVGASVQ